MFCVVFVCYLMLVNLVVDVVRSAIGFVISAMVLSTWSLVFMIGGKQLFGPVWNRLVMYNIADEYGLTLD